MCSVRLCVSARVCVCAWCTYVYGRERKSPTPLIKSLFGYIIPPSPLPEPNPILGPTMLSREQRGYTKKSDSGGDHYYVDCLP